jgi:hypothetical protein
MTRRLKAFFSDPTRRRRILSLDGGGVRGLLTLGVLSKLEAELRGRSGDPNYRLSQYFDLIGGTSTGSIIATALAFGWQVSDVWAAYRELMPRVFGKTLGSGILKPLYREKPLARALKRFFEAETLESANLETGLAIFAKRANSGSAWSFCNNPGWNYYDNIRPTDDFAPNRTFLLRSLVQASAAAPHYFRGVHMTIRTADPQGRKNEPAYFIDGGVCGYNNPALELLTMVRDPAYGFGWQLGADNIYLLSVGTGFAREMGDPRAPYLLQTVGALRTMINDVSLQQIAYMQAMSHVDMPWYINSEKRDQGRQSYLTQSPNLRYQRVDVRLRSEADHDGKLLPDTAEALRGTPLSEDECVGALKIANIKDDNAELLTDLGKRAGDRMLQLAPPPTTFDPAPWSRTGDLGPGRRRGP